MKRKKDPDGFLDLDIRSELHDEAEDVDVERVKLEIMKLFSHYDPLKTLSHLTPKERFFLARLHSFASPFLKAKFESEALTRYIQNYLLYSVSLNREGRKEFVRIASSFYSGDVIEEQEIQKQAEALRRALLK